MRITTILTIALAGALWAFTAAAESQGWHPWYLKKGNVSRADLIVALETDDRTVLRVRAADVHRQLANAGVPVGPETADLIAFLRSNKVKVVPCTPEILARHQMSRTTHDGKKFDFGWRRTSCFAGEQLLAYDAGDGQLMYFMSLGCGNVMIAMAERPAPAAKGCPQKLGIEQVPQGWHMLTWCRWTRAGATLVWGKKESRDDIRKVLYKDGVLDKACKPIVFVFKNTSSERSVIHVNGQKVAVRRDHEVTMEVCGRQPFGIDKAWIGKRGYIYIPASRNKDLCYPGTRAEVYFTKPGSSDGVSELAKRYEETAGETQADRMNVQICGGLQS